MKHISIATTTPQVFLRLRVGCLAVSGIKESNDPFVGIGPGMVPHRGGCLLVQVGEACGAWFDDNLVVERVILGHVLFEGLVVDELDLVVATKPIILGYHRDHFSPSRPFSFYLLVNHNLTYKNNNLYIL